MRRFITSVFILFSLFVSSNAALASGQQRTETLVLNESASIYETNAVISFYFDEAGTKSLFDISRPEFKHNFSVSEFASPVFKKSDRVIWARVAVNNLAYNIQHFLFYDYFAIYKLQVYVPGKANALKVFNIGRFYKDKDDSQHNRHSIVPLELEKGESILYFRIEQPFESLHFNIKLADAAGLAHLAAKNMAEISVYVALVSAFVLFNIVIFIVIRDKAYLFYSLHVFGIGLFFATFYGFPFSWLNISPYFNNAFIPNIISQISAVFSVLFFLHFLKVRERSEAAYRFFYFIIYAVIVNVILMLSGWAFSLELWLLLLAIGSVSQLAFAFRYVREDPYCIFYSIAWGLHLSIIVLYIISAAEIRETYIRDGHIMFGSIIEMLILTFALGYRFTCILKEKEVFEKKVAQVLEREDSLIQLSYHDPLTGTYNRRKFDEVLLQKIQQANKEPVNFSLILMDLDYFKHINDQYGHDTGDQVLKEFVLLVNTLIRKSDSFCRFGGEEFTIILESSEVTDAESLAEKIRHTLDNSQFLEQNISLSISCGVTSFKQGDDSSSLIQRADQALYQAKNDGRNKIIVFDTL
ncbi:MAG: GGDEF domain-containing protein [Gammaproteobacteria bacterium]|nr:GGDEF domain-containing protein [Gammaproteobacteria bacterium]